MGVLTDVTDMAEDQWGLVTTAQAERHGVTRHDLGRWARSGGLERIAHGVYRIAVAPPDEHETLRATWLRLDPSRLAHERLADEHPGVLSHRTAARLMGLGDPDADTVELIAARRW